MIVENRKEIVIIHSLGIHLSLDEVSACDDLEKRSHRHSIQKRHVPWKSSRSNRSNNTSLESCAAQCIDDFNMKYVCDNNYSNEKITNRSNLMSVLCIRVQLNRMRANSTAAPFHRPSVDGWMSARIACVCVIIRICAFYVYLRQLYRSLSVVHAQVVFLHVLVTSHSFLWRRCFENTLWLHSKSLFFCSSFVLLPIIQLTCIFDWKQHKQ